MTTAGDVITYVKNDQRITDTSLDATLLAWLNKNLVRRTRGREYPQLRVEGTTFQTTANVSTYATPTGFLRLVPNSVMYGYSTSSAGYLLPDVNTDTAEASVQAFFSEHAIPQAVQTLEQVLERQRINADLRRRESATLAAALSR